MKWNIAERIFCYDLKKNSYIFKNQQKNKKNCEQNHNKQKNCTFFPLVR